MAREFMPKSSALMPYVVVNRDAAVAGVFTVDGEAGSVDLTTKYVQITDYNQRVGSLEAKVTTNTGDITDLKTAVTSINGSIGTINTSLSNKAAKGVNSDITGLTGLSGPLRLGGDGVNAYDAVTLRQLQASSGGGSAVINGVMNNFLGAVDWWQGSTASFPTGYLPASGQTVNRADYPDLWAAINAGVFISTTESNWQATPTARGGYSTGDGSTTFRMPDLNGVQTNSIAALFLRGSSQGDPNSGGLGAIRESAAPNILGTWNGYSYRGSAGAEDSTDGAIRRRSDGNPQGMQGSATSAIQFFTYDINASRSNSPQSAANAAYGRNSATEVRPNSVKGTWIIRVTGAFASSSTNFSVYNGDASLPPTGTVVYGGDILSKYQVNGVDNTVARIRSKLTVGGTKNVEIGLADGTGSVVVGSAGDMATSGDITVGGGLRMGGGTITQSGQINFSNNSNGRQTLLNTGVTGSATNLTVPISLTQAFRILSGSSVVSPNSSGEGTISMTAFAAAPQVMLSLGDGNTGQNVLSLINNTRTNAFDYRAQNLSGQPAPGPIRINWTAIGLVNI